MEGRGKERIERKRSDGRPRAGGYGDTDRGATTEAEDAGFEGDPAQERKEELAEERAKNDDEAQERG